jgi:hypothetical protein
MKVPAQSSLIHQSILSLQDVSKASQSPTARGNRVASSGLASGHSSDIGVDTGGRSLRGRAARPNPTEASDARLETRDAAASNQRPARTSQREVPNVAARNTDTRNQPLGQFVDILV